MEDFEIIKKEIIKRAKKADACRDQYPRALACENIEALLGVIADNFFFFCNNNIIDCDILTRIGTDTCNKFGIYYDSATVEASGSAKVWVLGSANVKAWGSATVEASGSATVKAWGSATVKASGSATVEAWGSATVEAWGSANVKAFDSATVRAWGSAYIDSKNYLEHKVGERAILRYFYENKVVFGADINKQL